MNIFCAVIVRDFMNERLRDDDRVRKRQQRNRKRRREVSDNIQWYPGASLLSSAVGTEKIFEGRE